MGDDPDFSDFGYGQAQGSTVGAPPGAFGIGISEAAFAFAVVDLGFAGALRAGATLGQVAQQMAEVEANSSKDLSWAIIIGREMLTDPRLEIMDFMPLDVFAIAAAHNADVQEAAVTALLSLQVANWGGVYGAAVGEALFSYDGRSVGYSGKGVSFEGESGQPGVTFEGGTGTSGGGQGAGVGVGTGVGDSGQAP